MAWPLTPLTTYVASTTPAIKASDLNSIQSGINGIVAATYSLAAVVVDGTGGNVVTPVAGAIQLSAIGGSTSLPTAAKPIGIIYKDLIPFCAISFTYNGSAFVIYEAHNIAASPTRASAGSYSFTNKTAPVQTPVLYGLGTINGGTAGFISVDAGGGTVSVNTWNSGGSAADLTSDIIHVVCFGY